MKPKIPCLLSSRKNRRLGFLSNTMTLSLAVAGIFTQSVQAATYYWDNNTTTAGFGAAGGTWSSTASLFSTDAGGTSAVPGNVVTTTADVLNFGTSSDGLAAGTITISGTVNAANLTFGSASGAVVLSGGTAIAMGSTTGVITVNNTSDTIGTALTGTAGYSKEGTGTLILNTAGNSGVTGNISINAGAVRIDGSGAGLGGDASTTVTIASNASLIFNRSNTTTPAYVIAGAGNVSQTSSAGGVILNRTNTYSGGTSVSAGTLNIQNASAIGSGLLTITGGLLNTSSGGITLSTNNTQSWNGDFTFTGTGNLNLGTGAVTLNANRQVTVTANNLTVGGAIGDTGSGFSLTKAGAGTLTLAGVNTYSGGTTVSAGTLTISGAGQLNSGSYAGTISNAGTFNFNSSAAQTLSNGISGAGALNKGTGTNTLVLSGSNTYSGATAVTAGTLAGIGSSAFGSTTGISIGGSGTLSLRGDVNTSFVKASDSTAYSVTITGSGATINADQATLAGTSAKTMTIGAIGSTSTAASQTLILSGANNTALTTGAVTGSAVTTAASTFTLSNTNTTGTTTLASYTSANTTGGETLAFSGAGNTIVSGAITPSGTTLALSKSGAGTLTLNGLNTYTGNTSVSAGTLLLGNSSALGIGGTATMSAASSILTNAAVTIANNITGSVSGTSIGGNSANVSAFGGTLTTNTGNFQVSQVSGGTLTLSGTLTNTNNTRAFVFTNVGDVSVTGNIQQAASTSGLGVTQSGAGTTTLNGTNTYGGGTKVMAGTLVLGAGGSLSASNTLILGDATANTSGVFQLGDSTATRNTTVTSLTTAGAGTANAVVGGNASVSTLTVNNSGAVSYGGAIGGAGTHQNNLALTKSGAGALTLSGANTYTGVTTISGGTLKINGDQSAATGAVSVSNAGTRLIGTGTLGGDTTINTGAIQSAGGAIANVDKVGKQIFDAAGAPTTNVTYTSGSIFEWDLSANKSTAGYDDDSNGGTPNINAGTRGIDFDAVDVSGTLTVASADVTGAIFRVVLGTGVVSDTFWQHAQTWTDIFGGGYTLSGTGFNNSLLEVVDTSGNTYTQSALNPGYGFSVSGTTLTWSAVPEPTSAMAGLLIGAGLLRRRRA